MAPLTNIFIYIEHKQAFLVPKPTAPAIASGSSDAVVASYRLGWQAREGGSPSLSHLPQQFSVAENLGMERSTVAKRKKTVYE